MTEPYAALAAEPAVLVVLAAWGFAEAIAFPIVPDVGLGLFALAAPWLLAPLLGATLIGAVVGAIAAWWLVRAHPRVFERILAVQPALGRSGLAEGRQRLIRQGVVRGIAQIGPGLPLKAYLHALATLEPDASAGRVATLALVNRLTRIGPIAVAFALGHPLVRAIDGEAALLGLAYALGWSAFYVGYWWWRDPGRSSRPPGSP